MRKQQKYKLEVLNFDDEQGEASVAEHEPPMTPEEFLTGERLVLLDEVRIDGETQARVAIDEPTVQKYEEAYRERGAHALKAGVLFFDGLRHWLGDGFHRYHGGRRAGQQALPFDVRSGTRRDALLYALGPANREHGLPMSNADKRKAVGIMLADTVVDNGWATWTSRRIAEHVGCSHTFVENLRRELAQPSGNGFQVQGTATRPRHAVRGGKELVMETARPKRPLPPPQEDAAVLRRHEDAGQKAPPRTQAADTEKPSAAEEAAALRSYGEAAVLRGYKLGAADALARVAKLLDIPVGKHEGPEYIESLIKEKIAELRGGPLSVRCIVCKAAPSKGCTNNGMACAPHRDRTQAAAKRLPRPGAP